jgi:hypothetical protein
LSFYPRITTDDQYSLNIFEKGILTNSLPFGWVKVESKALPENLKSPALMGSLLGSVGAQLIDTSFIVNQIDTLLASQNIIMNVV